MYTYTNINIRRKRIMCVCTKLFCHPRSCGRRRIEGVGADGGGDHKRKRGSLIKREGNKERETEEEYISD